MKDFRELKVWERSHKLTLKIYKITSSFPQLKANR
ncbi:MAG: four helix bundle protein [Nitrospirae bacterium]|nr:four helix bundle protein [Nitrospirota bacterium]